MEISGNRRPGIVAALDLRSLGCLLLACFLVMFCFVLIIGLLFTDDDDSGGNLPSAGAQCNDMPKGMPNSPYVQVAWDDAQKYEICPRYFVNQINDESGFSPTIGSRAGALGIAQFMAGTAPTWGLKVGGGVDERLDPVKSLDAAARMMQAAYKHYYQGGALQPSEAYMKALAAYNAGGGNVQDAERLAKNPSNGCKDPLGGSADWYPCLLKLNIQCPQEPYNYIIKIMELKIPQVPYQSSCKL